jgi:hypothetical protein
LQLLQQLLLVMVPRLHPAKTVKHAKLHLQQQLLPSVAPSEHLPPPAAACCHPALLLLQLLVLLPPPASPWHLHALLLLIDLQQQQQRQLRLGGKVLAALQGSYCS